MKIGQLRLHRQGLFSTNCDYLTILTYHITLLDGNQWPTSRQCFLALICDHLILILILTSFCRKLKLTIWSVVLEHSLNHMYRCFFIPITSSEHIIITHNTPWVTCMAYLAGFLGKWRGVLQIYLIYRLLQNTVSPRHDNWSQRQEHYPHTFPTWVKTHLLLSLYSRKCLEAMWPRKFVPPHLLIQGCLPLLWTSAFLQQ